MPQVHYTPIRADKIPAYLKDRPQWACWQDNGAGKPPIHARLLKKLDRHFYAKPNDPATWASFTAAERYWKKFLRHDEPASGLSFALCADDDIVGIDLDGCRNVSNKSISGWAAKIIARFSTYTEISPSGTGIRMFLRGKLPPTGRHNGKIEVYDRDKLLSVTGRQILTHGAGDSIASRPEELLAWHAEVFGKGESSTREIIGGLVLNDAPTIDSARLRRLPAKARVIADGRQNGQYPSQSEADLALANYAVLAGWQDQDVCDLLVAGRINAGQTGEKLQRLDYYARTIAKAREGKSQNRKPDRGGASSGGADRAKVRPITIDAARGLFAKYLYLPNLDIVDVLLGAVAGTKLLETDPLWLMFKGAPGSGKTELLNAIHGLEQAEFVSNLTPAALISGFQDPNAEGADYSLLPQLDGRCLVVKDFTTILSMHPTARDAVYGILRDCYDGHASKSFGTGKREYKSRFNLLAGVTRQIESAWHLSALGERFLCWEMDVDRKAQTRRALAGANHEAEMREALKTAAQGVLAGVPDVVPTIGVAMKEKVLTMADLLARLRTYIQRDGSNVVHDSPEVEVPTRIVKQLLRLGESVALVRHKKTVIDDEFAIMRKVAIDSVPSTRRAVFLALLKATARLTIQQVADVCKVSYSAANRHLDDLKRLVLADSQPVQKKEAFRLTDDTRKECREVGLGTPGTP